MKIHDFSINDTVFFFSERLDSILKGVIEGFSESSTRIKIIENSTTRHIVSWVYVSREKESVDKIRKEYHDIQRLKDSCFEVDSSVHLISGNTLVTDNEGNPRIYQIVKIYPNKEVLLVDTFGEVVGRFEQEKLVFCSIEPIIKSSEFHIGQVVSWVEKEAVYEGIIVDMKKRAKIACIKRLLPVDENRYVEYYKLQSEDYLKKQLSMTTIVGDNIDSE